MYSLEKTKTEYSTLSYNNKYIHSKYNPIKEAENFAKSNIQLLKNNVVTVYGLGLGYHIAEISKLTSKETFIYVFEYNTELIKYCEEVNPNIFNKENIKIIDGADDKFHEKLSRCIEVSNGIIVHRPSLETIKTTNEKLYYLINDFNLRIQFYNSNPEKVKMNEENFEDNIKENYPSIDEFLNKKRNNNNKIYIVASAGPSLDFETTLLKRYRDKFNIIAVGSSFRTLISNNIIPDAVVIIDGKEIVKNQFGGLNNLNVPLCFYEAASKWAIRAYDGPKYIFGNRIVNNKIPIEVDTTVAVSAIDMAIKCGAEEVVLLGQDLAYLGDKSHTGFYEETYGYKDMEKSIFKIKKVKSVTGEDIETSDNYLLFKRKIESLIDRNKNIKFINCSNGVGIQGTEYMKFYDYINQ